MKQRRTSFRFLSILLGTLLALAADFSIRQAYLKFIKLKSKPESHPIRVADENFHHGIKPNSEAMDSYGPFSATYYSNSLGLRDERIREVPLQTDHPRILFIGDSFTEGGPIPWEKTFVGVISERLKPQNIEVLNAGVASYCPTTERVKLRYLLGEKGLKVDRVVLCLDISDLKDEFYYEEGDDGKVRQVPYGPYREKAEKLEKADVICDWLERNVENNFVIIGAIIRNSRLTWRKYSSATGVNEYDAIPEWAYSWPDYQGPYKDLVEKGLVRTKSEMSLVAQYLKDKGVPLTLVVYPWPQQVRAGTKPSRAETEWASWAKENGVQFISLFPAFINEVPADQIIQKFYWKNDAHWNEEGHRRVADALLESAGGIQIPKKEKN